jgi:hypothetical protein
VAILAADVEGYTRLMRGDEESTITRYPARGAASKLHQTRVQAGWRKSRTVVPCCSMWMIQSVMLGGHAGRKGDK